MKRRLVLGIVAAGLAAVCLLAGRASVNAGETQQIANLGNVEQPDTSSPDWKLLSEDLGLWVAHSDNLGLRGRLYVRRGGSWWPVAIDGAADIRRQIPIR